MKRLKMISIILCVFIILISTFSGSSFGAVISNRTIDNQRVFKLDDSTGTLTIQVKNGATEGGLGTSRKTENEWRDVWKKAYNDSTDIRPLVQHIVFIENDVGAKFDFNEYPAAYMFSGFTNLEDIDFSGVKQDSKVAETIRGMFQNCGKLKEVDLGWMATKEDSLQNMQDLFNGCSSLEKVIINNPNFITRVSIKDSNGNVNNGAAQIGRMFQGCSRLKNIDMSNITLYGRDNNWTQINDKVFTSDLESIEIIKMDNIKLPNFKNLNNAFSNLTTLTKFSMKSDNPGDIAPDVKEMKDMFKESFISPTGEGEAVLDISGLGKLENIVNMDGLIEGCTGLEILNIDNLDNSNIGPTNNRHSINDTVEEGYTIQDIGAKEFGREIFGKDERSIPSAFPNLTTISAQNSNVWMCTNNRGLPGSEYYLASNEKDVLYFTNKNTTFTPDGKGSVKIDSKRDYIDLITDRDGIKNHTFSPSLDTLPDAGKNINIVNGDLNPLGPGKLAPGIYEIGSTEWEEKKIEPQGSYYRISYLGEVPYRVEVPENNEDIVLLEGTNNTYINTQYKSATDWGNGEYVIDCSGENAIKIIYEKAAIDITGQRHDLVITINKITFKDLNKIPEDLGRNHDGNSYAGYGYYRTILRASEDDGIMFRNYVVDGAPDSLEGVDNRYKVLSGGSGTDIDFTVSIDGAEEGKTFVFYVDDLDVAAAQNWNRPFNDVCYDNLPIENSVYGEGGEGFILGEGNKLDTIEFADHTGLRVGDGNKVITTGSDPSTSWSEFTVKADATGANYTWTSGIACDSYALRNTLPLNNKLKIIKKWDDQYSNKPEELEIEITNFNGTISQSDWDKTNDNEWVMILTDYDHTHNPEGGYKVTETTVPSGYTAITQTATLEYNEETGYFEATLENKADTIEMTVNKVWEDTEEQRSKRPESIEIQVKNGDEVVQSYILTADELSHTFTELPKFDSDKNLITYTVDEVEVNEGDLKFYEKTIDGTTIKNTFKVPDEKINITVNKVWEDTEEQKDKRPAKIYLQVLDGSNVVKEYELDVETETSYTFTDLAKYDSNGNEIAYNIDEKEVNEGDLRFYSKKIEGKTITNTFTRPDDKIELTVYKKWVDTEKQSKRRPASIKIMIMNNEEIVQEYYLKTAEEDSHTFIELAKYDENGNEIVYTVDEAEVKEGDLRFYEKSINNMEITNTYKDISSKVIVKYIEKGTGKVLEEELIITGNVDSEYKLTPKNISGYSMVEVDGEEEGNISEETIEVIYYYEKNEAEQEDKTEPENVENPKTGDKIIIWVSVMVISLVTIYIILNKNKKTNKGRHCR